MVEHTKLEARVWLTPVQAVAYSGLGRARLYALLASGEIPSAKVGGTRHVRRRDIDQFMEQHMDRVRRGRRR